MRSRSVAHPPKSQAVPQCLEYFDGIAARSPLAAQTQQLIEHRERAQVAAACERARVSAPFDGPGDLLPILAVRAPRQRRTGRPVRRASSCSSGDGPGDPDSANVRAGRRAGA